MTFLEIRSANLEERRPAPSRNASTILDQIKQSAGNTPAQRWMSPDDRSAPLRPNDTDGGFAGFGVTPHVDLAACSFTTGDFSLFPASSSQTKDEISMLFENSHKIGMYHATSEAGNRGFLMEKEAIPGSMNQMIDAQRTVSTEETTVFSPMHQSVESRSTDDRSWDGCEEPTSLIDNTDGEEEEDDEEYTMTGVIAGTDDESYDSDEYDDDETFLSNEESKGPITGVESFLDELAEVEDVKDLGTLLFQVGTCHFAVNAQTADDDFSVDSDAFAAVPLERKDPSRFLAPPQQKFENEEHPPIVSASSILLEGTTDTIAMILHNMSVTTDSMFEIMNSQSLMSESRETLNDKNDSSEVPTPNNANLSFFQSLFSCQG
jgi:hypothetical protein